MFFKVAKVLKIYERNIVYQKKAYFCKKIALMKNFLLTFCLISIFSLMNAQSNLSYNLEDGVTQLEEIHFMAWSKVKKIDGYRIQLISLSGTNSKSIVERMQVDFTNKFPNVPAYVTYFEPNFRLRVGDFKTKLEAYHVYHLVNISFPGAFIIKDKIEFLDKY